ncbi:MAG: type I DNA topoisomerase [Candidatus Hydrogenedens sp.]|nr:type I DNA topoisomerase [Candidatus Hydrogenedens sp.]
MKLVIVESPAKAKTIGRFLGKGYEVVASYGHIRDLPSSAAEIPAAYKDKPWAKLGVDVNNNFETIYVVQKDSKKQITALKGLLAKADEVVLATDEDREGEAISWHLLETLKPKVPVRRIAFHEITQEAINEAISNPRDLDDSLVRAQESRRILDRLYGYELSPLLWKKVRGRLSAGRVQSVAVRLVVEREEERRAFRSAEYWDIEAELEAEGKPFKAALSSLDGKRIASGKDFDETTGALKGEAVHWLKKTEAESLAQALQGAVPWQVARVEQKAAKMRPYPPFTTSTLQQAASSLLGFAPRRTMQVAQRLYEGVDLGGGEREGLITYMRTDSVTLSGKALAEAGDVVRKLFGEQYHQVRKFQTKSKSAQEAHEAIRPTHLSRTPEEAARFVDGDELKLYRLIWNRTLASQMAEAELLKTSVDIEANVGGRTAGLRANGSVVTFPGFLKVSDTRQEDAELPPVAEGMQVGGGGAIALNGVAPCEHTTKPPARYTEASLIKRLEEEGIGRPSTYAPTISTIQQREYVEARGKTLVPTFLGIAVTHLLRQHFAEYVGLDFTARMEDALDRIANGGREWTDFLKAFYFGADDGEFGHGLEEKIEAEKDKIEFPAIPIGADDDGAPYVVRLGKSQPFIQRGEGGTDNTVTLPEGITYDELTVDIAKDLLLQKAKSNEPLGKDPETGNNVYALIGPYGPYVQLGEVTDDGKKPKRSGLPKGTVPGEVSLETALAYLSLPRKLGAHPETGKSVRAGTGPFGPYVVHDGDYRSLKAGDDVLTITMERAAELLKEPKKQRGQKTVLRVVGELPGGGKAEICDGRYGAYVTDGTYNATIPKDRTTDEITLDDAIALLKEAAERKPKKGAKKKAAAKKPAAKKKAAAKKPAAKKKA